MSFVLLLNIILYYESYTNIAFLHGDVTWRRHVATRGASSDSCHTRAPACPSRGGARVSAWRCRSCTHLSRYRGRYSVESGQLVTLSALAAVVHSPAVRGGAVLAGLAGGHAAAADIFITN